MTRPPDKQKHRTSPHSPGNRLGRVLRGPAYLLLFRWTPRSLHRCRNLVRRLLGATIRPAARVYPRARTWAPWDLHRAAEATIAADVFVRDRRPPGESSS